MATQMQCLQFESFDSGTCSNDKQNIQSQNKVYWRCCHNGPSYLRYI